MTTVRVLQTIGLDDSEKAFVEIRSGYPQNTYYTCAGNVDLASVLKPLEDVELETMLCGIAEPQLAEVPAADVILNAVCDADSNTGALACVAAVQRQLGLPVVNAPDRVLRTTRDGICRLLEGQPGVVVPTTVRIQPRYRADVPAMAAAAGVSVPFLVREVGTHGGTRLTLLEDPERLDELDRFAFDGGAYYVTQFVDFRSPDGVYRKYRVIVIDGVPYARHLVAAKTWKINATDRGELMDDPRYAQEEEQFLRDFKPERYPVFEAMASVLGLDYFGVDYAFDAAGDIVVFEANPCFRVLWQGTSQSAIPSHVESDGLIRASMRQLLRRRAGVTDA